MNPSFTDSLAGWGILFAAFLIYIIPTIVAALRNSPYTGPILLINLFAGWTLLGWLGALVWAVMPITRKDNT